MRTTNFSQQELSLLNYTNLFFSTLSISSGFAVIMSYCLISNLKTYPKKLVVSMAGAELLYSIANLVNYFRHNSSCFLLNFIRDFAVISNSLWALTIACTAYNQIKHFDSGISKAYSKAFVINITAALIPPLAITLLQDLNIGPYFGDDIKYCGAYASDVGSLLIDFPLWILLTLTGFYCLWAYCVSKTELNYAPKNEYKSVLVYPVVIILLNIPYLLGMVVANLEGMSSFFLLLVSVIATRSQGLATSVLYVSQLRDDMRKKNSTHIEEESEDEDMSPDIAYATSPMAIKLITAMH